MANWKYTQHKRGNGQQEIKVSIMVKELIYNQAHDTETWISLFKEKLAEIPRTNIYSAEFGYRAEAVDEKTIVVWKMKVNSDYNYKMFTLKRI